MASEERDRKSLGGGAEAAEGVHALQQSDGDGGDTGGSAEGGERPTTSRTGGSEVSSQGASAADRSGSEPLPRTREHQPSYGGAGGQPRTSSHEREPADSRGDQAKPPASPS
jgi:hypothetical protein